MFLHLLKFWFTPLPENKCTDYDRSSQPCDFKILYQILQKYLFTVIAGFTASNLAAGILFIIITLIIIIIVPKQLEAIVNLRVLEQDVTNLPDAPAGSKYLCCHHYYLAVKAEGNVTLQKNN